MLITDYFRSNTLKKLSEDLLRVHSIDQISFIHTIATEMVAFGITAEDLQDACVIQLYAHAAMDAPKKGSGKYKKQLSAAAGTKLCPTKGCNGVLAVVDVPNQEELELTGSCTVDRVLICRTCRWSKLL